jgi:hypothetical protein
VVEMVGLVVFVEMVRLVELGLDGLALRCLEGLVDTERVLLNEVKHLTHDWVRIELF